MPFFSFGIRRGENSIIGRLLAEEDSVRSLAASFCLADSFFSESFVNKESMCNFAARFNRNIFLTINILIERK